MFTTMSYCKVVPSGVSLRGVTAIVNVKAPNAVR